MLTSILEWIFGKKRKQPTNEPSLQPGDKEVFLAGGLVVFDHSTELKNFFATHAVSSFDIAQNYSYSMHLIYGANNLLRAAYVHTFGRQAGFSGVDAGIATHIYKHWPTHTCYEMRRNDTGPHQLGGQWPPNIQLDKQDIQWPFQYIGTIRNEDPIFEWLPFDLPIFYPVHTPIEKLWVDYTNPHHPHVIKAESSPYPYRLAPSFKNPDFRITFQPQSFRLADLSIATPDFKFEKEFLGYAGVPDWFCQYNDPDIPVCPQSGRMMQFVFQLCLVDGYELEIEHVSHPHPSGDKTGLSIGYNENIYVFFSPFSHIACILQRPNNFW